MGRKLPWLRENVASSKPRSNPPERAPKRQRIFDPVSDDEELPAAKLSMPKRTRFVQTSQGSPPETSPPPSPPKEELMCPGLDADDIYIMVEDEFHAIAQAFTHHLHHAEYRRLTRLAKTAHRENISKISRPTAPAVGTSSTMSKGRKIKRAQDENADKHEKALGSIGAKKKGRVKADAGEDSDVEIVRDDDPWVGTTLQSFMTSPSRKNTSLVGLQNVTSNTRAAAGFKKAERMLTKPRTLEDRSSDTRFKQSAIAFDTDGEGTTDDDDLDVQMPSSTGRPAQMQAPTRKVDASARKASISSAQRREHDMPAAASKTNSTLSPPEHKSILKRTKAPPNLDSLEDYMRPTPLLSGRMRAQAAKKEPGTPKHETNEIPIFLL